MHRALRAVVGGIAGTIVMTVVLLVMEVETRSRLSLFEALARFFRVPDQVGVGFLVFLLFGSVVWPLVFTALVSRLPPENDYAVKGMLFATALWVLFMVVGTGELNVILFPLYAVMTLLAHLAYGFVLGLVYGWTAWQPATQRTNHRA